MVEKRPTNSGKPPLPPIRAMPERKLFFWRSSLMFCISGCTLQLYNEEALPKNIFLLLLLLLLFLLHFFLLPQADSLFVFSCSIYSFPPMPIGKLVFGPREGFWSQETGFRSQEKRFLVPGITLFSGYLGPILISLVHLVTLIHLGLVVQ